MTSLRATAVGNIGLYLLLFLATATQSFATDDYYQKPCTVQANDAKTLAGLRDKGKSMETLRHHVEATRPSEDQDALLNVLGHIFTTFKAKTPGDIYEATLFSCDNHGKDTSLGPMSEPSSATPRGYLNTQEEKSCAALFSKLQGMVNELTEYERQLDQMKAKVDASYAQLNASGKHASHSEITEHNKLASAAEQLSGKYAATAQEYNKRSDRYNKECAGKATR